ncbi:MAG TPA: hypothetical protein VER76_14505 [Pyrinomonadaceae bacterium]|nr:hypothetical protein [Pyrinomonadaceae bacterium]
MAKRTTRITVETHSLTVLRTRDSNTFDMWCAACGAETQMVTVRLAASLCSVTQRTIFRLVEAGSLHFNETNAGELLICEQSLQRRLQKNVPDA